MTKIRPNTSIPFKDPTLPLNHPTWPGNIDNISNIISEDGLTEVIITVWQDRASFETPNLTEAQEAIRMQSIQWCVNNNITVTLEMFDE
jgi:hypothetical protein